MSRECKRMQRLLYAQLDERPASPPSVPGDHLQQCAACRAELQALWQADQALRLLARLEPAPEMPPPVVAASRLRPGLLRLVGVGAAVTALLLVAALAPWSRAPQVTRGGSPPGAREVAQAPPRLPVGPAALGCHPLPPRVAAPEQAPAAEAKAAPRLVARARAPSRAAPAARPAANPARPQLPPGPPPAPAVQRPTPSGVVLLVSTPQPAHSYSYQVEVSLPDGQRSNVVRKVECDADGTVTMLHFASETIGPDTGSGG